MAVHAMAIRIHHSSPCFDEMEGRRVKEVIMTGQVARGSQVTHFQEEMGRYLELPPGLATSSGTSALHLALLALGAGPGDEVLLPSYVCSAPLHAIRYTGATPVFVDVDPATGNLDLRDLERRLTSRSKVILVVHLFGLPVNTEEILSLGPAVLEDCAQALGARTRAGRVGATGHMSVTSFYATKLMTTGEGGMVFSPSAPLLAVAGDLVEYDKRDDFRVRFNYKMTDLAASMGRCQLQKLDDFLEKRNALAKTYDEALGHLPCRLPPAREGRVYYRYVIGVDRDVEQIIARLRGEGIEAARPIFRPLHAYFGLPGFTGTDECWSHHLSLPMHPNLSPGDVETVCGALAKVLEETAK